MWFQINIVRACVCFVQMRVVLLVILVSTAMVKTLPSRTFREAPMKEPEKDCVCVTRQQCSANFTLNKYGGTIIDIRLNKCPHGEVCCKNDQEDRRPSPPHTSITGRPSQSLPPTPIPTSQECHQSRGCGFRNFNGVGYRISGEIKNNEAQFGEFPWLVAILEDNGTYICAGSLIHPKVVLTSVHYVRTKKIERLVARAGEWDRGTTKEVLPHQDRKIDEIINHEDFQSGTLINDISLLILKEPMNLAVDNVNVICLPSQDYNFDYSHHCSASGWGSTKTGATQEYERILKKVELPIVPNNDCQKAYQTNIPGFQLDDTFICAGGVKGLGACKGDGGSPLMCPLKNDPTRYELAGIVTWGIGCGDGIPGIYVGIARFIDWISKHLAGKGITVSNTYVPKSTNSECLYFSEINCNKNESGYGFIDFDESVH